MDEKQKVEPLVKDTHLAVIKNSVGSKMFRNLYANVDGVKKDITENGNLSCAFFASSILLMSGLIKNIHATVIGTIKDLEQSGWIETQEPKEGAILVWAEKDFGEGRKHKHIGFYIGNNIAISNSSSSGFPTEHNFEKYEGRTLEKIFWNPKLD